MFYVERIVFSSQDFGAALLEWFAKWRKKFTGSVFYFKKFFLISFHGPGRIIIFVLEFSFANSNFAGS